jgi:ADP-ribose pyrophosphatase YjhB (NUDIX family)
MFCGSNASLFRPETDRQLTSSIRHKYAAISGGVEPEDATPLKAALREIHEETSLTSDSLHYLCLGNPYSFVDPKVNYEWSVHPFAFHWPSTADGALTLGWEHEGYAWFRPREIRESDVAGGVLESLRRVWPEGALGDVDGLCQYCLGEAVVRRESGKDVRGDASEAFNVFASTVKEITPATNDADQWRRQARLAAWHVWNYSHPGVKGPLLARLVPTLEQLEELLLPQSQQPQELGPQFEKLVTTALDSARTRHVDNDQADVSENSPKRLAQKADRFFSALWDLR